MVTRYDFSGKRIGWEMHVDYCMLVLYACYLLLLLQWSIHVFTCTLVLYISYPSHKWWVTVRSNFLKISRRIFRLLLCLFLWDWCQSKNYLCLFYQWNILKHQSANLVQYTCSRIAYVNSWWISHFDDSLDLFFF